jgi:predicted PurR-regulated permease PerM
MDTNNKGTTSDRLTVVTREQAATAGPVRGWIVTALFVLAVFYTLYLTRELTLPIVLALLLGFLFRPIVVALNRLYVPTSVGAALIVLALVGGVAGAGYALAEPASLWLQKSPIVLQDLERKLRPLREKVEDINKAAQEVEKITKADQQPNAPTVAVQVGGTGVRSLVLDHTQSILAGSVLMFFLLYFLLSTWDTLVDRLALMARSPEGERNLRNIIGGIERHVFRYLASITIICGIMGVLTALLMYFLGMPNPILWGALAAILNFVPYIGPMVMLVILTVVALLTFDTTQQALLIPGSYLLLETLEGQLLTPVFLGKSLSLNPVMIFLGIIFWGWLWGPAGALLAVPILMTFKIICSRVQPLASFTPILSR